jgi:CheY-like chemotaxis protein/anti-sigma regulatory factor (Ser/Thr protein kinase)
LHLFADSARLVQVIGYLLGNACKYSEDGTDVHLHVDKHNDQVAIRVRDSGIGLASEELDRVFERFAQVDASLERSKGGMGIGLGLVKRLVELHGGTVEARSDGPGRGAEFIVRLPLAAAPVAAVARHSPARPALAAGLRILVVDDNRDAADSLATLLQMSSHHVRAVHDGLDAVAAAEAFAPQVVLLDLGLPTIDGYETARRMRPQQHGGDLLLVALSGWGQAEDLRRSRDAGFDAHLVKPVRFTKLMELLAEKMAGKSGVSPVLSAARDL